jgi:ubiquinone/menaquinone biosynthesis C-methylase UbiE
MPEPMNEERTRGFTASSVPEAYDRYMAPQLFEPWARELLGRTALRAGSSVLDVACGTGVVARLAAAAVGPDGRVVASDISPAMLAVAAARPAGSEDAATEYLECSALELKASDSSFDAVLCQQGLQFFPDRGAALREMHRVVRPGGMVAVATWAAERPLGFIGPMTEALAEAELDEPYPRAFDPQSYCLDGTTLHGLLAGAGLRDILVELVELEVVWHDPADAIAALMGTPYGPLIAALPPDRQQGIRDGFARRLPRSPDGTITVRTTSHLGRGVK